MMTSALVYAVAVCLSLVCLPMYCCFRGGVLRFLWGQSGGSGGLRDWVSERGLTCLWAGCVLASKGESDICHALEPYGNREKGMFIRRGQCVNSSDEVCVWEGK